ncbi:hypothetical protein HDU93_005641 [Gonapodya sp. JEL0774]|nr:hypothetical protein HDU93_005641 [Gonapodya sp. JEL0774]
MHIILSPFNSPPSSALAAGVRYIVFSSVGGLTTDLGRAVPEFGSKYRIEQYLKSKPWADGYAILRPVNFMDNIEMFGPLTQGSISWMTPPNVSQQVISVDDIGAFATMAFVNPELFRGKETELAGDVVSGITMANALSEKTGVPWSYSQMMPKWAFWLVSRDLYNMEVFFEKEGYKADIPALRALKPDLHTFSTWLDSRGIGNISKGENTYAFAKSSQSTLSAIFSAIWKPN